MRAPSHTPWHNCYHDGGFRLSAGQDHEKEVAAHDSAAAPLVLHTGQHAPPGGRPRIAGRAHRQAVETCFALPDAVSVAADAWTFRSHAGRRKPLRGSTEPVRHDARRPAEITYL